MELAAAIIWGELISKLIHDVLRVSCAGRIRKKEK
jgi:hypothetical protein